jgi:hypothetical protein
MAKKKSSSNLGSAARKTAKKVYKKNKHNPVFWIILLVLLIAIGVGVVYVTVINPSIMDRLLNKITNTDEVTSSEESSNNNPTMSVDTSADIVEGVNYPDFQIHFMTLGNEYAGDSIYIKAGNNDILIDAGSRSGSSSTTLAYMDKYVKDKKLEQITTQIVKNIPNTSNVITRTGDRYNDVIISTISDNSADPGLICGVVEKFVHNKYPVYLVEVG